MRLVDSALAACLICSMYPSDAASGRPLLADFREAQTRTPDVENGRRLYGYCMECHGPKAWGFPQQAIPQTAGQHRSVIIKQLRDIRAGNRAAPRMRPYAREDLLGGPQGIADVAGYLSSLPMTPWPSHGSGRDLGYAGALYKTRCAHLCHGLDGAGDARTRKPRIQGQHYEYLLLQLRLIRDGRRRNADKAMVRRLQDLSDAQLEILADYVSRLQARP